MIVIVNISEKEEMTLLFLLLYVDDILIVNQYKNKTKELKKKY